MRRCPYWVLSDSAAAVRYVAPAVRRKNPGRRAGCLSELLGVQQPALAVELAAAIGNAKLRSSALVARVRKMGGAGCARGPPVAGGRDFARAPAPAGGTERRGPPRAEKYFSTARETG
jgi:hypothetical protein